MEIIKTTIEGLLILKPKVFQDDRGYFFETYSKEKLKSFGLDYNFVQDNESMSLKGVLRGLHFQKPPFAQVKLIRVIKGGVLDIVVDLRKNSSTYGESFAIELNEDNKLQFLIPKGFAHGFLTLEDNTIFSYKVDTPYNPQSEGSILWNDADLNINWAIDNPILSAKDINSESFANFNSPF